MLPSTCKTQDTAVKSPTTTRHNTGQQTSQLNVDVDTSNAFVHRHGFISPYESATTTPLMKFDVLSDTSYSPF
eukprot:scaffold7668_cov73-Skeletonema_dohrnii-CCMP3373.AAC.1